MAKVNSILKTASNHFVNWFNSGRHQISTTSVPVTASAPTTTSDPTSGQNSLAVQYNGDLNLLRQMLSQLPDGIHVTNDDALIFPLMSMMKANDSAYALVGGVSQVTTLVDGVSVKAMAALQDRLVFVGSNGMGITMAYSEINSVVADCGIMSCDINISKKNGGMAKVNSILQIASNHFVNWFNSGRHQISTMPAPATASAPTSDLDSLRKEIEELEKSLDD